MTPLTPNAVPPPPQCQTGLHAVRHDGRARGVPMMLAWICVGWIGLAAAAHASDDDSAWNRYWDRVAKRTPPQPCTSLYGPKPSKWGCRPSGGCRAAEATESCPSCVAAPTHVWRDENALMDNAGLMTSPRPWRRRAAAKAAAEGTAARVVREPAIRDADVTGLDENALGVDILFVDTARPEKAAAGPGDGWEAAQGWTVVTWTDTKPVSMDRVAGEAYLSARLAATSGGEGEVPANAEKDGAIPYASTAQLWITSAAGVRPPTKAAVELLLPSSPAQIDEAVGAADVARRDLQTLMAKDSTLAGVRAIFSNAGTEPLRVAVAVTTTGGNGAEYYESTLIDLPPATRRAHTWDAAAETWKSASSHWAYRARVGGAKLQKIAFVVYAKEDAERPLDLWIDGVRFFTLAPEADAPTGASSESY